MLGQYSVFSHRKEWRDRKNLFYHKTCKHSTLCTRLSSITERNLCESIQNKRISDFIILHMSILYKIVQSTIFSCLLFLSLKNIVYPNSSLYKSLPTARLLPPEELKSLGLESLGIPSSALISCVTLGKLFNHCELQFPLS